jgi:riboflavin kinase/FMN adenylyltransferase
MKIIWGIENFIKPETPVYIGLGNFDGVHLGHKELFTQLITRAQENNGQSVGLIFEPHPSRILNPSRAPRLLLTVEGKAEILSSLGLDVLIYTPFSKELSRCLPEEFVESFIINKLMAKEVFVGFNYSFGHKGVGTPGLLSELGEKYNFKVTVIPPVKVNGEVVSSTLIRKALDAGDIKKAYSMLGYYPFIEGQVVQGEKRGAAIGFPTANLQVSPAVNIPSSGVYVARAVVNGMSYKAAVNIGKKPTFHDDFPVSIEAHLINFDQQIYGEKLKLHFLDRIRGEKKFSGIEELKEQIKKDREKAMLFD